ncbi:response regulator [Sinorhizobium sp. RAC02]|uniref:response regulator transcription factor n=1 Tax=Sinorhizobium sp. RAC02 TaxID=1842534 RepID=UPI00083DD29B|nr:response regulator [Sinorhizobium sp. RAC02]AOF91302.1 bacterial regulatory s, luxR family protein [Sinorhizobium sp. RAC02]
MTMAPVYLVDDDEGVRSALSLLLGTYGIRIETFGDPTAFLARAPKLKPGVLLLDLRMPAITGLQLHEKLGAIGCDWPTIICTGHGDVHACRRAFKAGVVDFLTKPIDEQVLIEALQQASSALDQQAERAEAAQLVAQLTDREREVLDMVGRGWSTREIAETLQLSPRTVDTHRANIAQKLGTTSVAEFARLALIGQAP